MSSKIELTLQNMPWHVQEKIAEYSTPFVKLSLRQSSEALKKCVDKTTKHYDKISIVMETDSIDIEQHFDDSPHYYVLKRFHQGETGMDEFIESMDFFKKLLQDPKSTIRELEITLIHNTPLDTTRGAFCLYHFGTAVRSLNRQLLVFQLSLNLCRYTANSQGTLQYFKPGTLRSVCLNGEYSDSTTNEFVRGQQWKQAKRLVIRQNMPFSYWNHFEEVSIYLNNLSVDTVARLVQNYRQNPNLKFHSIMYAEADTEGIQKFLFLHERGGFWRIYTNGAEHLRIQLTRKLFEIRRVKPFCYQSMKAC